MPSTTTNPAPDPSRTDWDLARAFPDECKDWRYEVENGDTLQSFRTWLEHALEVRAEDEK